MMNSKRGEKMIEWKNSYKKKKNQREIKINLQ